MSLSWLSLWSFSKDRTKKNKKFLKEGEKMLIFCVCLLGGSLADAISMNYRSMSYFIEAELKDLLLQVGRGLKYIHSMSLVHMDIKPSKYYKSSDLCPIEL